MEKEIESRRSCPEQAKRTDGDGAMLPTHAQLLTGLDITVELIHSRVERKPVCSTAGFTGKTAWAG
jgi:hypothetical protein